MKNHFGKVCLALIIVLNLSVSLVWPVNSRARESNSFPAVLFPSSIFDDVPADHPYYSYISMLKARGVTVGCSLNPPLYCPDSYVTRDQMAAFIERALGDFYPPQPASQRFTDVGPDNFAYAFIEEIAARGITVGCGTGVYCPTSNLTREQLAIFLERTMGRFSPPPPQSQRFVDVDSTRSSYPFVESFVSHSLSLGIMDVIKRNCNNDGLHYCPDQWVTRAEMAAFLAIGLGWSQSAVAPSITSVSPTSANAGSTVNFFINGSTLSDASTVSFTPPDGIGVSITSSLSGQIKTTVTISSTAKNGTRTVTATTPGGPSNGIAFRVGNVGNLPPTVSITQPSPGAIFTAPATITISATATDSDGTVSQVDFYQGTTLVGSDASAPYSIIWANVAAGSYSLTAKATDNAGATTTSNPRIITVGSVNQPPVANAGGPYAGNVGTAIQFDGSASYDPDGAVITYNWSFGDGGTDTGATPTHAYSVAGTFSVTLTVTDDLGSQGSQSTTATASFGGLPEGVFALGDLFLALPFEFDWSGRTIAEYTILCPTSAGGDLTAPNYLYLTSTNRAELGVEALVAYFGQQPFVFEVYDWARPASERWQTVLEYYMLSNYLTTVTVDGINYQGLTLKNSTRDTNIVVEHPGSFSPTSLTVWENTVYLLNSTTGVYDLVYSYQYNSTAAQQHIGHQNWGPVFEASPMVVELHNINPMGYYQCQFYSGDLGHFLNTSDCIFYPAGGHDYGLQVLYRAPNYTFVAH